MSIASPNIVGDPNAAVQNVNQSLAQLQQSIMDVQRIRENRRQYNAALEWDMMSSYVESSGLGWNDFAQDHPEQITDFYVRNRLATPAQAQTYVRDIAGGSMAPIEEARYRFAHWEAGAETPQGREYQRVEPKPPSSEEVEPVIPTPDNLSGGTNRGQPTSVAPAESLATLQNTSVPTVVGGSPQNVVPLNRPAFEPRGNPEPVQVQGDTASRTVTVPPQGQGQFLGMPLQGTPATTRVAPGLSQATAAIGAQSANANAPVMAVDLTLQPRAAATANAPAPGTQESTNSAIRIALSQAGFPAQAQTGYAEPLARMLLIERLDPTKTSFDAAVGDRSIYDAWAAQSTNGSVQTWRALTPEQRVTASQMQAEARANPAPLIQSWREAATRQFGAPGGGTTTQPSGGATVAPTPVPETTPLAGTTTTVTTPATRTAPAQETVLPANTVSALTAPEETAPAVAALQEGLKMLESSVEVRRGGPPTWQETEKARLIESAAERVEQFVTGPNGRPVVNQAWLRQRERDNQDWLRRNPDMIPDMLPNLANRMMEDRRLATNVDQFNRTFALQERDMTLREWTAQSDSIYNQIRAQVELRGLELSEQELRMRAAAAELAANVAGIGGGLGALGNDQMTGIVDNMQTLQQQIAGGGLTATQLAAARASYDAYVNALQALIAAATGSTDTRTERWGFLGLSGNGGQGREVLDTDLLSLLARANGMLDTAPGQQQGSVQQEADSWLAQQQNRTVPGYQSQSSR